MAITVKSRVFGVVDWSVSGEELVFSNLISRGERKFYALNPEVIDSLEADKDSVLTTSQINSNLIYTTSSDLVVTAADYADSNWTDKGWDVENEATILDELQTFILNNFDQQEINTNFYDMVIILTKGEIGGVSYTIPFAYFGVVGEEITPPGPVLDSYTSMLLHFNDDFVEEANGLGGSAHGTPVFVEGMFDSGVHVSSGNNYVVQDTLGVNGALDFGTGNYTIDFWVKIDSPSGAQTFFSVLGGGANNLFLQILPTGNVRYGYGVSTRITATVISDYVGQWVHFALIREGDNMKAYYNGELIDTDNQSGVNWVQGYNSFGADWAIGAGDATGTSLPLVGTLDEFRVSKGIARWTEDFTPPVVPYPY